jgi:(4-alkanoyl-5-oxo-2,5-dihydrofuran-3-yl)methyl phosphate reductase
VVPLVRDDSTILVTGATGNVGLEVVAQLVARGQCVRALTRQPDRASFAAGVEVAAGDLGQPETLARALAGVERVFLLTNGGPETPLHDVNLVQAAAQAGVRHVVKLSVIGNEYGQDDLITAWHLVGERALRLSGLAWTFLRPGSYMSNALHWAQGIRHHGVVHSAYARARASLIDPRDVAAVAVEALVRPGHEGRAHRITGPEALSAADQVARLGAALGRPLRFVESPASSCAAAMGRSGRSPLMIVAALANLGNERLDATRELVLPTVEEIIGRPAHTFDEWAVNHVHAFR